MVRKRTRGKKQRSGKLGGMRSGFKGLIGSKKKGNRRSNPKQFYYIVLVLFVVGVVMFFASRSA
jgi:hypothetical protein